MESRAVKKAELTDDEKLTCGNWLGLALLHDLVDYAIQIYPSWRNARDEGDLDRWLQQFEGVITFVQGAEQNPLCALPNPYESRIVGIHICRSSGFTPPTYDKDFIAFVEAAPIKARALLQKEIDVLSPRDYGQLVAREAELVTALLAANRTS